MKKLKNLGQLLMALVITITSVFGNTFVVFADTNPNAGKVTATKLQNVSVTKLVEVLKLK